MVQFYKKGVKFSKPNKLGQRNLERNQGKQTWQNKLGQTILGQTNLAAKKTWQNKLGQKILGKTNLDKKYLAKQTWPPKKLGETNLAKQTWPSKKGKQLTENRLEIHQISSIISSQKNHNGLVLQERGKVF